MLKYGANTEDITKQTNIKLKHAALDLMELLVESWKT